MLQEPPLSEEEEEEEQQQQQQQKEPLSFVCRVLILIKGLLEVHSAFYFSMLQYLQ